MRSALAVVLVLGAVVSPPQLTAQGTDRELSCRGGPGISFEKEMDPSPRDTAKAILLMRYRTSTKAMEPRDVRPLEPGTCTWNPMRGTWNQRDSLRIEADLYLREGKSAITSTADLETGTPLAGALHRANSNDYPALCARLRDTERARHHDQP